MKNKHLVLAGDGRQKELFALLKRKEKSVQYVNGDVGIDELKDLIAQSETIVLPTPLSRDDKFIFSDNENFKITIDELIDCLSENNVVYAGGVKPNTAKKISEKNVKFTDCMKEESFVTYNAYLTAQGTLRILLENTSEYLPDKRILITGFGKVAKAVAQLLCSLGCDVYVAARKKLQRTEAELSLCKPICIDDINSTIYLFDFIINTVPAKIFSKYDISCMKDGAVYIELASAPFGAEYTDFEEHNKNFILGSALPGKFCEKASAKAIFNEIK